MNVKMTTESALPPAPRKQKLKLGWDKKIYFLLIGLALATGAKVGMNHFFTGPMPPGEYAGVGGDFTLQGVDGPVSLHDLRGKVAIVFFGYSHCVETCQTALSKMSAAFRNLKEMNDLDKVKGVFITLDPARDSAIQASDFAHQFHPEIIGLSGSARQIDDVARRYSVGHEKEEIGESGNYAIGHTGYLYVIRPDGQVGALLSHTTTPKDIVKAVNVWMPWANAG